MKKILSLLSVVVSTLSFLSAGFTASVSAADLVPYRFQVIAATTAYTNESIDVTVKVLDRNGTVVPNYRGTIMFTSNDLKALLPYQSLGYQFKAEDRGEKTFSKGVTFKNVGTFNLTVNDLNDDIEGKVDIKVSERSAPPTTSSGGEVEILTPENNSTQAGNSLTITGKSRKSSKVGIFLNGTDVGSTLSDSDGAFIKTVTGLTESSYVLQAKLYDANNSIIGQSPEVKVNLANDLPTFYGASFSPTNPTAGAEFTITIEAESWLAEASYTLDGITAPLTESPSGKYSAKTVAPQQSGSYDIDVMLKNNLGQVLNKTKAASLQLSDAPLPKFQNVKAEVTGSGSANRVVLTFGLDSTPANLGAFQIAYGESASNLSGTVKTYDAEKIKKSDGTYSWYIPDLTAKTWYFQITPLLKDGTTISWTLSDILDVNIAQNGCVVGNVSGLTVDTQKDKSILRWDSLSGALSYRVYKKEGSWSMTLIDTVKDPTYVIYLSPDALAYADFGIKALCSDGKTESVDMAMVSKVQTGPALILFLALISGVIGLIASRRRYLLIGR